MPRRLIAFGAYGLPWAPVYAAIGTLAVHPSLWQFGQLVVIVCLTRTVHMCSGYIATIRVLRMILMDFGCGYRNCYYKPVRLDTYLSSTAALMLGQGRHRVMTFVVTPLAIDCEELAGPCAYPVFGGTSSTIFLPHRAGEPSALDRFLLHHEVGHIAMLDRFSSLEREMALCAVGLLSLECIALGLSYSLGTVAIPAALLLIYAVARLSRALSWKTLVLSFESGADSFALEALRGDGGQRATELYRGLLAAQYNMDDETRSLRALQFDHNLARMQKGQQPRGIPVYSLGRLLFLSVVAICIGLALPQANTKSMLHLATLFAPALVTLKFAMIQFERTTKEMDRVIGPRIVAVPPEGQTV